MFKATKDRVYRINTGTMFVAENIASGELYEQYGSLLMREPRLAFMRLLHEGEIAEDRLVLEGYYNDLYKLFLRKLSAFDCQSMIGEDDKNKLRLLLEEMIKVKGMLCTADGMGSGERSVAGDEADNGSVGQTAFRG